ncbi:hypothetical protein ZIOFF_008400 [Zingiber officinale]|uniref:Uncharacterized protein n=1 Tax=Zingiber officinale TaxID=94328 RepID=A0A8J5HYP8_ZINOF|nr:hypothetical protein ZIOFF_008400 [Zingiber officinale]
MASTKISALVLTYALIAVFLHPLMCRETTMTTTMNILSLIILFSGKTIDQGIAYMLMLVALLITYLVR